MVSVKSEKFASFLLRTGLGLVFLYAAASSLIDPGSWIGFLPSFMRELASPEFLLTLFSIYEILLAVWLISGKETFHAALLSAATMFAIVIQNIGALDILFRDVAILFAALSLAVLSRDGKAGPREHQHQKIIV